MFSFLLYLGGGGLGFYLRESFLKTEETLETEPFVLRFDFLLGLVFKNHFDF
ncbi:hypothetical protein HMPREF1448_00939 [Helicobacter pylori HP260AFi]|uniref:Outer membrane protein n=1 Tax=Helicobacter pylori HP260AFii TaxID=1159077 RepID=A0ABC9S8V0_HELPX|nr:hypothetical protein HMPREF1416_00736 [Helicobacter pylori GAM260ASi]EMH29392.1 hypothetical protein HMPREF1422_01006 [Helicobacter pylori GAM268Bii]EMH62873.1 hypothetical protein HMPREF1448_00939 [Helicobacter pylori HP260AFi]EMH65963.1 hypothetical protein HMPREF1450_01272 [Helicobacter pylori HP260ASii]EMH66195.1 hypothetical protein HMPREF1449_01052 [Helicobacter pylori HP260AFii]